MLSNFIYIDGIIVDIVIISNEIPACNRNRVVEQGISGKVSAPYAVYNIGGRSPLNLKGVIKKIESTLGMKTKINFREMQPGNVCKMCIGISDLLETIGYKLKVALKEMGVVFVEWNCDFNKVL